ncbi:hypothetical protein MMC22_002335 [Lobaria immixta]|nr:hypothetical protein [Lobaria immixta]
MEGPSQNSQPNELVIPDDEAYAMTQIETWEVVQFLMTKLKSVHLEDLDPDDRRCAICQEEFLISEDERLSHAPIETVCGHIFGKTCIIKWLDPLCYWGLTEGADPVIHNINITVIEDANTSCPKCRKNFFPMAFREPMELLAARLWFWDNAYAFAGVARSEKEERSRKDLWNYVKYCRSINEFKLSDNMELELIEGAQRNLAYFANQLKNQALTPVQEGLRTKLEEISEYDLKDIVFDDNDGSHLSYLFNPIGLEEEDD